MTDIYKNKQSIGFVFDVMQGYIEEFKEGSTGLYLSSKVRGSGKTRAMATIANELMDRGYRVKFATSSSILEEIKKTWSKDSEYTESSLIDGLISADVLVIDDFGTEHVKDWINDKFYYIINERYINNRTTMFTSNEMPLNLDYDKRIINRIIENCYQLQFPEESVREKIAKKNARDIFKLIRK